MMPPPRRFLFPLSLEANLSPPCGEDPASPIYHAKVFRVGRTKRSRRPQRQISHLFKG